MVLGNVLFYTPWWLNPKSVQHRRDLPAASAISAPALPNKDEYCVRFYSPPSSRNGVRIIPSLRCWAHLRHEELPQWCFTADVVSSAKWPRGIRRHWSADCQSCSVPPCFCRRVFCSSLLLAVSACLLNVKPGGSRWLIKGAARSPLSARASQALSVLEASCRQLSVSPQTRTSQAFFLSSVLAVTSHGVAVLLHLKQANPIWCCQLDPTQGHRRRPGATSYLWRTVLWYTKLLPKPWMLLIVPRMPEEYIFLFSYIYFFFLLYFHFQPIYISNLTTHSASRRVSFWFQQMLKVKVKIVGRYRASTWDTQSFWSHAAIWV